MKNYSYTIKIHQGFSLVELLVSLVIASIIFGGVVQVALSGKQASMDGEEVSFIQDNARFVLEQIKRDTRSAGFLGCAGLSNSNTASAVRDSLSGFINLREGIQGFEGDAGVYPAEFSADVAAGTDAFLVRFADASETYNVRNHNAGNAEFTLWSSQDIALGSTMMVTDSTCRSVGLFQVTGPGANANTLKHETGARNCTNVLKSSSVGIDCTSAPCIDGSCGGSSAASYLSGATIMPYRAYAYYIGDSDIVPNMPALKRRVLGAEGGSANTSVEEIALGIEDLQLIYGVDIDADGVANRFIDADDVSDWAQIVSLRLTAIFRSSEEVFAENQNVQIQLDGSNFTLSDDKFLRQVVSTTVRFRNL